MLFGCGVCCPRGMSCLGVVYAVQGGVCCLGRVLPRGCVLSKGGLVQGGYAVEGVCKPRSDIITSPYSL